MLLDFSLPTMAGMTVAQTYGLLMLCVIVLVVIGLSLRDTNGGKNK